MSEDATPNPERELIEWADDTEGLGDGQRSVKIEPTGHLAKPWALWLSETTEGGEGHADWTTRDWCFFGATIADAVDLAAVFMRTHLTKGPSGE